MVLNEPYVSSRYGPNNHSSMPAMLPDEGKKDWRARVRSEMEMRISIWPRSPSPPKLKSKTVVKPIVTKKEIIPERSHSSKSKKSDKSSRKADRHESRKNKKSNSPSKAIHEPHDSDTSDQNNAEIHGVSASNEHPEPTIKRAYHEALGLNEYERAEMEGFRRDVQGDRRNNDQENDDADDIGPLPMVQPKDYAEDKQMAYGKALMPGEGEAIAMYVQQNMRIPRRGEIGWSGEEINGLEEEGYVMSGSRHKKMNAVRIRKENQVYSAEEKRALALITFEEKQQKDNKVVGDFRQMLTHKLTASGHMSAPTEKAEEDEEN